MAVLPIGRGHVDFDAFFSGIFAYGYDGDFTVETTALAADGTIDFAMLNECFERIRGYVR